MPAVRRKGRQIAVQQGGPFTSSVIPGTGSATHPIAKTFTEPTIRTVNSRVVSRTAHDGIGRAVFVASDDGGSTRVCLGHVFLG